VAVGIVAAGVIAFATSSSVADATYRRQVRAADAEVDAQRVAAERCIQAHGGVAARDVTPAVRDKCVPAHFASVHDRRFHRQRLGGILKGTGGVLAILGLALGATLVGAEFASRGMTTLLTYEPRRLRVLAAKVVTGVAAMAAFAFVSLVALGLALLPALVLHGAPLAHNDPSWAAVAGAIGRGTALVAVATGIGMAIATLGRSTAAALGAGFAYIVVLEYILGAFLKGWRPWLLLGNVIVFVSGQNGSGDVHGRSVLGAGIFLALVATGLLALAAVAFRQRDIA
jgi:ABC-type transport system involved in multi-copper enzyme maturation permease subunit